MNNLFILRPCVALVVVLRLVAGSASAQQISPDVRVVALNWLLSSCSLEGSLEDQLKRFRVPLETLFLEALEKGPDNAQLLEVEKAAAKRFEQRRQLLAKREGIGLKGEEIERAQKISRDEFIAREKSDFSLRFKSQAAAGLGIVGGDKAKPALQKLAADETSPLKSSAQQALAKLQGR